MDPLIWNQSSQESESLDKEDLGLLAGKASLKALFRGGKHDLQQRHYACPENSSKMTLERDSFPFVPLKAQTLMITPLTEPFLTCDRYVRSTNVIGASRPDHNRIVAPFMNEDISSKDDILSTVRSDIGEVEKLPLPFSNLLLMKGIRHLRELKKVVQKVSSQKLSKSLTVANG